MGGPRPWRRLELLSAALCATASLTVPLLPHHPLSSGAAVVGPVLLLAVVALRRRMPWTAAGAGLMAAGDVVFRVLWWVHGAPVVPSLADVGFVLGYLALLRAAQLAAGPGRSGASLDALIVVVGPSAVVAAAVHAPLAAVASTGSAWQTAQALVAPVFDLALLVLVVRASVAGALTRPRAALLQAAVVLLLVGNAGYLVLAEHAYDVVGPWLGAPFGLAFALAALAVVLGPAAPPVPRTGAGGSRLVLALLPASVCLPAGALVAQGLAGGDVDWQVLGTGALLAAALSTVRLLGALRTAAAQARELERLVLVDDLTGLPNRRACSADLQQALAAGDDRVALALLDLDRFKAVNDSLGHAGGDALLRAAARAWAAALPPAAGLFRWGGEEFVVLLRGTDALEAEGVLHDVRLATPAPHTVSAGLTARRPGEGPEALLARADALLYRAKDAGRDRVCTDAGGSAGAVGPTGSAGAGTREAAGAPAPTAS
ncbi:GGDEF domain-containing protein [Quadrisphaera sp. INWT6]|uniref:GGDEF domain-containing protein n=1 Tax=Quadrisphaera sp. INWT6 TaxID=2596917 RepID=UPI0018920DF2|nr:GGDEF domain-containing protein [Quadrisphaera sp. INWT6]MBF5080620.1 GGDEF domain-containing protein [Quadrisphaera sp. INWT6]